MLRCGAALAWLLVAGSGSTYSAEPQDAAARKVLATHCLACHGGASPRGGLDLTTRDGLLEGGETGAVVDLQEPAQSRLLAVVEHLAEPAMPFKRPKLSDAEIDILRRWIRDGAPYSAPLEVPAWWSLQPLANVQPPAVPSEWKDWPRNPVDHFIAAEWSSRQLGPASPADRRALLRRVYFDLWGLPPTPAEINDFLADTSDDAYEKVVMRLLASPHYGERWARFWMDLAHYAETHGHDQDRPRPNSWPYRDYLIRSFNQDKPYARFVQEQIAGDVLDPDDPDTIVAMGFLAAGPWDESSLRDIRDDTLDRQIARYLDRDDMVATAMSTFVSTTVHCARCHDHKFDPVPQADYYRLQAVFSGIDKGERNYDADRAVSQQRRSLQTQLRTLPKLRDTLSPELLTAERQQAVADWEAQIRDNLTPWTVVGSATVHAEQGSTLTRADDGSYLASGTRPEQETYVFEVTPDRPTITGVRLEVLDDASLPHRGPGRQDNGNLHLNEVTVAVVGEPPVPATSTSGESETPPPGSDTGSRAIVKQIKLVRPQADFNQAGWTIEMAIDGKPATAWGIYPEVSKPHVAVFEFAEPVTLATGQALRIRLEQTHGGSHLIGRPRLSITSHASPLPLQVETLPAEITDALKVSPDARTERQRAALSAFVWKVELEQSLAALPPQVAVYSASNVFKPDGGFVPSAGPRPIHVLKRGDIRSPGAEVQPGALTCLDHLPGDLVPAISDLSQEGQRRLALARWLTDEKNVLTWRSIVNRVWQRHFGRGLVDTPSDFGRMGSIPTHPALLDWLAQRFLESGGSLKQLDYLLVTSATYRQSSASRTDYAERDADARYLWRMPRTRLDAECVRDAVLRMTGKLDPQMGGRSVKQFIEIQGMHVTPTVDYLNYDVDNPDNYRRSVYRFIFRTLPDPFMEALDCADSSQLTPVRNTSVTALQALATFNNRFMVRQSEHLASRLAQESPDLGRQVERLYELVLNRPPTAAEAAAVAAYAREFGMANTCRVLLNANEFLFVD